ncbi:minor capsid protein [Niallia taxi]|uniref:minor capsid protein n=1 Tax=Niallia taxi TaxID=2499688 RepID=UPI00293510CA|nr:minor capsid protein [Niallia taxi]WOD61770.1 minor capsid protein [Niallia taxi]
MDAERKSYWEQRMIQLFLSQDKRNTKLEKKINKEYLWLEEQIKKEIAAFYTKYSKDDVIEYRKLVLSLTDGERNLLYQDYDTFAKKYPKYAHLMPVRESIYKLNRLEGLQLNIRMNLLELGAYEEEQFQLALQQTYENGYLTTMKGLSNAPSFFTLNSVVMVQTLNENWIDEGNFSTRIWGNKERLIKVLNNEIRDAFIRGDDYRQMAKIIQHRTGVGENDAKRLLQTEYNFVMNQANKQAFKDAGVTRYEISAVMDKKTSRTCRNLDGEQFEMENAKVGVNYPPFHARCRTTVIPVEN